MISPILSRPVPDGWRLSEWAGQGGDGKLRVKRIMDVVLATVLIILTGPALILAMLMVRVTSEGPVIFRQRRVGYRRMEFVIFKLRTMRSGPVRASSGSCSGPRSGGSPEASATGCIFEKIGEGDARVTPVGRVLRKLSLDELPQLFNVLRGEMSLVGPRPLLLSDMVSFPPGRPMCRFDMMPGLTGLWQVSGRSLLSDADRIRLDMEYVERWSTWLDLKILLRTPLVVLRARGAV